jgi:hypothetical protein
MASRSARFDPAGLDLERLKCSHSHKLPPKKYELVIFRCIIRRDADRFALVHLWSAKNSESISASVIVRYMASIKFDKSSLAEAKMIDLMDKFQLCKKRRNQNRRCTSYDNKIKAIYHCFKTPIVN